MNSELDLLQAKLTNALEARKRADQNLEQKSLEIYNLKQDLTTLEKELAEAKASMEQHIKADVLFSKNINEEVKAPLNAILGMTHILEQSELTSQQSDQLSLIKSSAGILNTMLSDILDFSKRPSGRLEINNQKFDIGQFMDSIMDTFSMRLDGTPITMRIEQDSGFDKLLLGDHVLLRKIIMRLVKFAHRNTREGYIYLRTRIIDRDRDRISVRFEIEDTGIGIEKEKLKNLFDPYQTLYTHTGNRQKGVGLAYVKKIVQDLGGDIHVSSRLGTGTKFSVLLNLEETNETMRTAIPETAVAVGKYILQSPVLLIEDSQLHQQYMSKLFEYWGCAYVLAENSIQAIELARTKEFSIIFLDMHLSKLGGIETIRAIRKFGNINASIPIVAMSSVATNWSKEEGKEMGLTHLLTKPFHPSEVMHILSEIAEISPPDPKAHTEMTHYEAGEQDEQLVNDESNEYLEESVQEVEILEEQTQSGMLIHLDKEYLREQYAAVPEEALENFENYLDNTPGLLYDMKYCERLSQVANISRKLIPSFQSVGLGSFTNELNMLVDLAQNSQHEELNEKIDSFLLHANEAVEIVKAHYQHMRNSNSIT